MLTLEVYAHDAGRTIARYSFRCVSLKELTESALMAPYAGQTVTIYDRDTILAIIPAGYEVERFVAMGGDK